ncbi:MAG: acyltransferase domain-containing protein, partial [Gemmatimonadales bacterium]
MPEAAIAVVGMACRFPGAPNIEAFWRNLVDGVESIEDVTDEELLAGGEDPDLVRDPAYVKRTSALSGMALWDAGFFGLSPKEAAIMDPQLRHFLELCWEGLESAGYAPGSFDGATGVFAGCGAGTYMMFNVLKDPNLLREQGFFLLRHIGNDKDFLATRVAYHFDLRGPALNVQTACSTSLAAIHLAVQSLLSLECDAALAGGVTITHPHRRGYLFQEGEILSPDGRCRAFDRASGGTVLGDGAGVVVLRRLEDALADGDTVHAVIRGTAVNNDGSGKVGFLAPSVDGQARVISEALAVADVDPATVGYVEAHGTGTRIGDPIEVAALTRAFRAGGSGSGGNGGVGYCGLGSVKTNIGHLDTAAGVAGFIKAVLALRHRTIPASLHFEAPNPELQLEDSPFRVVSETTPWRAMPGFPRRAGVSSLGVGGTNVHVVLEEAPAPAPTGPSRRHQLLLLSGRSRGVVGRSSSRLVDHLEAHPEVDLADVAWTLQRGRAAFGHRRALVASSTAAAIDALVTGDPEVVNDHVADDVERRVAFLFAGGGAQYPGMAAGLYRDEPEFRREIDRGLALLPPDLARRVAQALELGPEGTDASGAGRPRISPAEMERPTLALPALFLVQHAQARLWMSWGIAPSAMIGHSMGEYTAACLAEVLSLEEALELVVLRGELFERVTGGGMLSVPLSEEALRPFLGAELSVAAVNGPELCVASGPREAIDRLEETLRGQEVEARRIHIDVAAHSAMLDPILEPFRARLRVARLGAPSRPFVSNLTGTWITDAEATDPEYWVRQLRQTVRFADGLSTLLSDPNQLLLEVGPGRTLATLARLHPDRLAGQEALTSLRHPDEDTDDQRRMLEVLGTLWQRGTPIDWAGVHAAGARMRIPLPTYPFEGERHLVDPPPELPRDEARPREAHAVDGHEGDGREEAGEALEGWLHEVRWTEHPLDPAVPADPAAPGQGDAAAHPRGDILLLAPDSEASGLRELAGALPGAAKVHLARPGPAFGEEAGGYRVRFDSREDLARLLDAVAAGGALPARILHAGPDFFALLALGQALGERIDADPVELVVLTRGGIVADGDVVSGAAAPAADGADVPYGSLVAGPVRVLPAEIPGLVTRWIDLEPGAGIASSREALERELAAPPPDSPVALRARGR